MKKVKWLIMLLKSDCVHVKKAILYFTGQPGAMINYAIMLYAEEGVQIDRKEALNYFRIAADKGHQEEMFKYT